MKAIHAIVTGRVQGVFFRNSTRQFATSLSITGWVRNNRGGSVELIAVGEEAAIDKLLAWLHDGPSHAQVDKVTHEILTATDHSFERFEIL